MLVTMNQTRDLRNRLHRARHDAATGVNPDYVCKAPRVDADGNDRQWIPKPRATAPVGTRYPNGDVLELRDNVKGVWKTIGIHGTDFLGIDPATGEIRCAACEAAKGGAA